MEGQIAPSLFIGCANFTLVLRGQAADVDVMADFESDRGTVGFSGMVQWYNMGIAGSSPDGVSSLTASCEL